MKIKNIMMLMMISSLLIASTSTVIATDETKTILDDDGDVVDAYTQEPYNYPNIDITEVIYEREGTNASVTITVDGEIENLGDITDPYNIDSIVTYTFYLTTDYDMYTVIYINNNCIFTSSYEEKNITDYSIEDSSSLKINFNINNSDEIYDSLAIETAYMSIDLSGEDFVIVSDSAGDLPLMVDAYVTSPGEKGVEIEFIGYAEYGQSPYVYEWDFDGDNVVDSNERNPTHIYDKPGIYDFTFTVTDDAGSTEYYTDEIEILGEEDGDDTPGFELIIAIIAIGAILFLKRKR